MREQPSNAHLRVYPSAARFSIKFLKICKSQKLDNRSQNFESNSAQNFFFFVSHSCGSREHSVVIVVVRQWHMVLDVPFKAGGDVTC